MRSFSDPTPEELRRGGSLKWSVPTDGGIGAWVAEMDFGIAPAVADAVRDSLANAQFGYLPPWLEADYGAACADWQRQHFGWQLDPGNIHPVGDVLAVLGIVIDHFTPPEAAVILPTPAYMPFLALPPVHGRRIIEVPCISENGYYRMDLDRIDAAFDAGGGLLILCNPHNPTGRVYSRAELLAVSDIVSRHGGRVFADEIHAPIVYDDSPPHLPYASLTDATAAHTITGTSMSKAYNLPGLKCAAAIVSNDDDARVWAGLDMVITHGASTLGVAANIAAYRDDGPWWPDVLAYLDGNRARLTALVADHLPGVAFRPPEGSYLAWLDFRGLEMHPSPGPYLQDRAKVWLNDGPAFGAAGRGFARLNMATPRPILETLIERIATALP